MASNPEDPRRLGHRPRFSTRTGRWSGVGPPARPTVAQEAALERLNDEVARQADLRSDRDADRCRSEERKLVGFGQDKVYIRQLPELAALETKAPLLDGIAIHTDRYYHEYAFNPTRWDEADLIESCESLTEAEYTTLRHNFLWTSHASQLGWDDDEQWAAAMHNWRIVAKLITLGRMAGVVFDPETYHDAHPWSYHDAVHRDEHSYLEYEEKLAERGEEWIRMMQEASPNLTVLTLFFPYKWEALQPGSVGMGRPYTWRGLPRNRG